jgi:predicted lipoprotein with Yx(FWY)xxD motif
MLHHKEINFKRGPWRVLPYLVVVAILSSFLIPHFPLLLAEDEYGIEIQPDGQAILFFNDQGWRGNWNYLCVDNNCIAGTKNGNRWERNVTNLGIVEGNSYQIQLKIDDAATGQYISPYYTVVATQAGAPPPPVIPSAPSSLNATANSSQQITLSWSDNANNEAGFQLERATNGGSYSLLTTLAANTTTYSDANLSSSTAYQYRVRAYNDAGHSSYSNVASATTLANNTPSCTNGIQDGDETGIDCGGSCPNTCDSITKQPIVDVLSTDKGTVLVGGSGSSFPAHSLYTFDNDTPPFSTCNEGCVDNWPPVLVNKLEDVVLNSLPNAAFPEAFGVSGRCDGTLQLTYNNKPLYFYVGDNTSGQTNGDGVGGVWWLVKGKSQNTCSNGIKDGDETGVDCGGSCPNTCIDNGISQCTGYGVTIINGQGYLYAHESLGQVCYMCTGPGYQGCVAAGAPVNGFYMMKVNVTAGQEYSFGIQCGPNVIVTGIAGENNCYFTPSCSDGFQNGDETGVDCGGSCAACPTCDDGIQNGDETGIDCGGKNCPDCATVCNGTPNPFATLAYTNETVEAKNDGTITFNFPDVSGRSQIQFSIDGGSNYAYTVNDNSGSFRVENLAPSTYPVWARWSGGDCPLKLGDIVIGEGGPAPTCSDGILNQGEERVDCGGPCGPCPPNTCGNVPLVLYPTPALATPITGKPAKSQGWAFDLSQDLRNVTVRVGEAVAVQMGGNQDSFEFFCSCNQVEFSSVKLNNYTATVPQKCQDAGNFYYFFRYKKNGNTTQDPGDIYHYSTLFTTQGQRIDPDTRPTITTKNANWMRYRHPHPQDGITEAIFDAQHNGSRIRQIDRFETIVTDAPNKVRFEQFLYDSENGHPNKGLTQRINVRRMEFLEKGESSPPTYAVNLAPGGDMADLYPYSDVTEVNYGNVISYEITAVTVDWPGGAQNYNTFQNYVVGQGFNTFGDPRLALAGRASTNMVITGTGGFTKMEADAIFTQHLITLEDEDDVDDFLEGHHLFHGVRHRGNGDGQNDNNVLGEVKIGKFACGDCHFRDGRGGEVINTPRGPRVPPAVYGIGLLEWVAGKEAGLRWDGQVATVRDQTINALKEDHGIDPAKDISQKDLDRLVAYTKFLTVPTRSKAAYDDPDVIQGEKSFLQIGCASCHQVSQKTRSDAPIEFRNIVIRPYTDMKLHNVTGANYRTPALWGLGRNIDLLNRNGMPLLLMHDGRATTLEAAIEAHGGEASGSRAAYRNLSATQKANLIKFLKTL